MFSLVVSACRFGFFPLQTHLKYLELFQALNMSIQSVEADHSSWRYLYPWREQQLEDAASHKQ